MEQVLRNRNAATLILCTLLVVCPSANSLSQTRTAQHSTTAQTIIYDRVGTLSAAYTDKAIGLPHVEAIDFSPDGRWLAAATGDATVKVWSIPEMKLTHVLSGHHGGVHCIAFSPDGNLLASAGDDKTIQLWDAANGELLKTLSGHHGIVSSINFASDSKMILSVAQVLGNSAPNEIWVWDVAAGKRFGTFENQKGTPADVTLAAISADDTLLAFAGSEGMQVRENKQGGTIKNIAFKDGVVDIDALAFSRDNQIVAASYNVANAFAGQMPTLQLWSVATCKPILGLKAKGLDGGPIALTSDGKLLVTDSDGDSSTLTPYVWIRDASTGRKLQTLPIGQPCWITSVALNHDDSLLAAGCGSTKSNDINIHLWRKQ